MKWFRCAGYDRQLKRREREGRERHGWPPKLDAIVPRDANHVLRRLRRTALNASALGPYLEGAAARCAAAPEGSGPPRLWQRGSVSAQWSGSPLRREGGWSRKSGPTSPRRPRESSSANNEEFVGHPGLGRRRVVTPRSLGEFDADDVGSSPLSITRGSVWTTSGARGR